VVADILETSCSEEAPPNSTAICSLDKKDHAPMFS